MTSLARQLESLALPHTQAVRSDQSKRVSLLFEPAEAANLDKEAVLAIGVSGLEELIEIDSIFLEYENTLFNESASSIQRLVQSSDVNKKLDECVKVFLVHLSPYFLLRPAQKSLEWLIYRYQIHFYNMDDLLTCAFPYHDTNMFTRVLQILDLSKTKSKWHWLEYAQKHGTHLPTQTIATHAYKDEGFLNFVATIPEQCISVHGSERLDNNAVQRAVAFYTKIILCSVQLQNTVKESYIAQLSTFIIKGLKSYSIEYKCSSYMILSAICSKVSLNESFLQLVVPLLTKRVTIRNGFEALSCLVFLFKTQPLATSLPKRCFKHLCRLPGIVQHLTQLHEWGTMSSFWPHFISHLVPAVIKDSRWAATSSSDGGVAGTELLQGKPEYWAMFESLLSDCILRDEEVTTIIRHMCNSYIDNKEKNVSSESDSLLADRVRSMLHLLEQRYCHVVDAEIENQMNLNSNNPLIEMFARLSVSSFKYLCTDDGTNLLLSLNSASSLARRKGVEQLASTLHQLTDEGMDKEFVSNAIYARLLDDDADVVQTVVKFIKDEHMLKYLSAKQLVALVKAVSGEKTILTCVRLLSQHPGVSTVRDEVIKLVLINTHLGRKDIVSSFIKSFQHPLFSGAVVKGLWKKQVTQAVATNIAMGDSPHTQVELLVDDTDSYLTHAMTEVLASLCLLPSSSVEVRIMALDHLLKLCERMSLQQGDGDEKCRSECLAKTHQEINALFKDWPGHWWTEESVVQLLHSYLTRLLKDRQVTVFVDIVGFWTKGHTFYEAFSTMISRKDDYLALNLVSFVTGLPDTSVKGLVSGDNGDKVVASVISLLARDEKLVRRVAIKLLTRLSKFTDKDLKLRLLVETLLAHSEEIRTDSLQLPEILVDFLQTRRSKVAVGKMLELICDETTPSTMASSLLHCFDSYRDLSILSGVEPLLQRLLDSQADVGLLLACLSRYDDVSVTELSVKNQLWTLFINSLSIPACRQHSLSLVTKSYFASLPSIEMKAALLSVCLDVFLSTEDSGTHVAVSKLIRRVTFPAEIIREQFESLVKSSNPDHSMKTKKMRRSEPSPSIPKLSSSEWSRVRLLLEWLQIKKKIENMELIVPSLFRLVTQVLEMEEQLHSDYIKQLLLGCLNNALNKLICSSEYKELLRVDQLNMESVVQCIRTSSNPQTHTQALILLRTTARLYPDVVLNHVMSIFTYMGASMMRQDDAYSFQIITNTLETVVPEIVKVSDESGSNTITGIIRVFVDAYPHIPEHRRLTLFFQLLRAIGDKYLYVCSALSVGALVTSTAIPESADEAVWKTESNQVTFMVCLFAKFDVNSQLEACTHLLEYLCSLPSATNENAANTDSRRKRVMKKHIHVADGLFDTTVHTDKQLRHFKYESAGFIVSLLSSNVFIEQFVNSEEDNSQTIQFNKLVEMGLRYINLLAQEVNKHAQQPTAKFWKALLHKAYEILHKINALLPNKAFIDVITSLLSNELPLIRRKALDLLNNRLPQTSLSIDECSSLVDLVSVIESIASGQGATSEDTEDTTNRQTALYSLKILARILANSHSAVFTKLLADTCKAYDEVDTVAVKANILLLLGELVYQLKINSVHHLTTAVPLLLSTLQQQDLLQSNHLLWISAVMALQKMMESVPTFLSGYLTHMLVIICTHSSFIKSHGDLYKGYKSQLPARLKTLRECTSKELSPRILVPVFSNVYPKLSNDKLAVEYLMSIIADHVKQMSKDDLTSCHHKLLDFLLLALDYRSLHHEDEPRSIDETEDTSLRATLKMVVKLSEASFRPMYFKLYGWATRDSEIGDRLITFYRLSDQIADTLRSLFSIFASHIIKNAADTLNAANTSKSELSSPFEGSPHAASKDLLVSKAILNCLYKCFLYNTDGFVTKQRLNIIMEPLVDQLENIVEDYDTYVKETVVPCITQLAMAARDDSLWKPLTYQICLKTRHSSPEVRKGALHALQDLSTKLGEDFMTLLPEAIPFLAELMEDEQEEVENLCQEVIGNMETMLGEPLQKYF